MNKALIFLFSLTQATLLLQAERYPEISLCKDYILELEDPKHHYGPKLNELYQDFLLLYPDQDKTVFFSLISEFSPEIPSIIYLNNAEEQRKYIIHISSEAKVIENLQAQDPLMFVMDSDGNFYAHKKVRGNKETKGFQHSSFTGGVGVSFAGNIKIGDEGIIEWINDDSGHYKPSSEALISLLKHLESNQIPLEKMYLFLRRTSRLVSAKDWLDAYRIRHDPIPGENIR